MSLKIIRPPTHILLFLPSLAVIPVLILFIKDMHLGGIDLLYDFLISAVNPSTEKSVVMNATRGIQVTVSIAFVSWIISTILGLVLGIISSNLFYSDKNSKKIIPFIIRKVLCIPRSIHELVWGLILLQIFGLNSWVAILAIAIPYSALFARVISDQIDLYEKNNFYALRNSGVGVFASSITTILPSIFDRLFGYTCYRFECSIRGATLLGIFGLGGIGNELKLTLQSLQFREMWTSLWFLGILMFIISKSSKYLIKLFKNDTNFLHNILLFILYIVTILSILNITSDHINYTNENFGNVSLFSSLNIESIIDSIKTLNIINLIITTIFLTVISSLVAIGIPPVFMLIFPSRFGLLLQRCLWGFCRLFPSPLFALLLLLCSSPSIYLAALALGIHNAGIMGKWFNDNIYNENKKLYRAFIVSGVSERISILYGILTNQGSHYLTYGVYRSDIILKETAVIGVVGGAGLGWQLIESISSFNWNQVLILISIFSLLSLLGESLSELIRTNANSSSKSQKLVYSCYK